MHSCGPAEDIEPDAQIVCLGVTSQLMWLEEVWLVCTVFLCVPVVLPVSAAGSFFIPALFIGYLSCALSEP